jgi:hypothetical protein
MSDDVSFGDWLKPSTPRASEELSQYRLKICQSCEFFSKSSRCKKCKCFMKLKTELADARCPIHKW